ncbi:hypothetical protein OC834_000292 [Tilletia horrida]|nr:hypothetical protein OC834_000292 [Tilletia horrida]
MRLTALFLTLAIAFTSVAADTNVQAIAVAHKAAMPAAPAISSEERMVKRLLSSGPGASSYGVKATHEQPQRVPSDSFKPAQTEQQKPAAAAAQANTKSAHHAAKKATKKASAKAKAAHHHGKAASKKVEHGMTKKTQKREANPGEHHHAHQQQHGKPHSKAHHGAPAAAAGGGGGKPQTHGKLARPPHGQAQRPAKDFSTFGNAMWKKAEQHEQHQQQHGRPAKDFDSQKNTAW